MAIKNQKLKLVCVSVTRIKEHGVESNVIVLGSRENRHDSVSFEEHGKESAYVVGREYEISIGVVCNG